MITWEIQTYSEGEWQPGCRCSTLETCKEYINDVVKRKVFKAYMVRIVKVNKTVVKWQAKGSK